MGHTGAALSRRVVLRGVGGAAVGLPLLTVGRQARAAEEAGAFPKRLVIYYVPNGPLKFSNQDHFWPRAGAGESDFILHATLAPLEPFRSRMLLVRQLDMRTAAESMFADPHVPGMCNLLTGTARQQKYFDEGRAPGGFEARPSTQGDGISLDQKVAGLVGGSTRLRSLNLGVLTEVGRPAAGIRRISFSADGTANPAVNDPHKVFGQLFGDAMTADNTFQKIRAQRLSVLDTVQQQFARLRKQISGEDARRLDAHLELVRELERTIMGNTGGGMAVCARPAAPASLPSVEDSIERALPQQLQLLATALTCDITRVAVVQIVNSQNEIHYPFIRRSGPERHGMNHNPTGVTDGVPHWQTCLKYDTWHIENLAAFLRRLEATKEGAGTVLDNTVVMLCTEMGDGSQHDYRDIPMILVGGGGLFRTGRYLRLPQARPHNDFLFTVYQAFGGKDKAFGAPAYNTGPLTEMLD